MISWGVWHLKRAVYKPRTRWVGDIVFVSGDDQYHSEMIVTWFFFSVRETDYIGISTSAGGGRCSGNVRGMKRQQTQLPVPCLLCSTSCVLVRPAKSVVVFIPKWLLLHTCVSKAKSCPRHCPNHRISHPAAGDFYIQEDLGLSKCEVLQL